MLSASECTDCTTDGAAEELHRDQGRTRVSLDLWVLVDTAKEGVDIVSCKVALAESTADNLHKASIRGT